MISSVSRCRVWMVCLGLAAPCTGWAQSSTVLGGGPTLRGPWVESYHGVAVADPYRWLEATDSPSVLAWARTRDGIARSTLSGAPGRERIRARIHALTEVVDRSVPVVRRGDSFFLVLDPASGRNRLQVQREGSGRSSVVVDPASFRDLPDAAIVDFSPDPSARRVAYLLSADGERSARLRVLDTTDGRDRPLAIADARLSRRPWLGTTLFVTSGGDARTLYAVDVASPAPEPRLVPLPLPQGERLRSLEVVEEGPLLLARVERAEGAAGYRVLRPSAPATAAAGPWHEVWATPATASFAFIGAWSGSLYFRTDLEAPKGRVVAVDPSPGAVPRSVVPEGEAHLDEAFLFGGRILSSFLVDARPGMTIHSLDGRPERGPEPPFGLIWTDYLPGWSGFSGDERDRFAYFRSLNLTAPGIYRLDLHSGEIAPWAVREVGVDPRSFVLRHVFVTSRDGTRVPMFIAHRSDVRPDSTAPALLFAYGAFGWTPVPFFNAKYLTFLEMGGVFAIPYVRGGGVYGPAWHRDGSRERKQNTVDDLIAAAEWLVANGYARKGRLAVEGNGPGGTVAGAAFLRRPDLWGGVIIDAAPTDLIRRESVGSAMTGEFGSIRDEAEFRTILGVSPYHNATAGTRFGAALIKVGDRDQVVPPLHGFKMAAALEWAQRGKEPVLLRVDWSTGHGFTKALDRRRAEWVDDLSFLDLALGLNR